MAKETAIKRVKSLIEGKDANKLAEEIINDAKLAIEIQQATQKGVKADAEKKLKDAKEKLENAIVNNGKSLGDRDDYIRTVVSATQDVDNAQAQLDAILKLDDTLSNAYGKLSD